MKSLTLKKKMTKKMKSKIMGPKFNIETFNSRICGNSWAYVMY